MKRSIVERATLRTLRDVIHNEELAGHFPYELMFLLEHLLEKDIHMLGEVCPGWVIREHGNIEWCEVCRPVHGNEDLLYEVAHAWAKSINSRFKLHEPIEDECPGCMGFDVFECRGSMEYGPVAILRSDACGVFDDDSDAHMLARALYAQRWVGHKPPACSSSRSAP